jgi:hypothetical protein
MYHDSVQRNGRDRRYCVRAAGACTTWRGEGCRARYVCRLRCRSGTNNTPRVCASDIRAIADPAAPPSEAAFAAGFTKYNEKEMISVEHEGNQVRACNSHCVVHHALNETVACRQILLSSKGSVGDNKYMEPRTGTLVTVDPVKQVLSSICGDPLIPLASFAGSSIGRADAR